MHSWGLWKLAKVITRAPVIYSPPDFMRSLQWKMVSCYSQLLFCAIIFLKHPCRTTRVSTGRWKIDILRIWILMSYRRFKLNLNLFLIWNHEGADINRNLIVEIRRIRGSHAISSETARHLKFFHSISSQGNLCRSKSMNNSCTRSCRI